MTEKAPDLRRELKKAVETALTEDTIKAAVKKVQDAATDLSSELEYRIKEDLAHNLAWWVQNMAAEAIDAILAGDEEEMRKRLSCQEGHYTGRDKQHHVIHHELFETGALLLRKQIVNAFPELLKNERILDLEDQVKSLVAQVNKLELRNNELIEKDLKWTS